MDLDNIRSWASQPDVCRCCLSTNGKFDITASYLSENGIKEVYSDMLRECYGITLSYLTGWGPSRLVCSHCIGHLRDASSFRKQVLQAEKHFVYHCSKREGSEEVLVKSETELNGSELCNDEPLPSDDDKTTLDRTTDRTVRKRRKVIKRKRDEDDSDSDTPIARLSKKYTPSVETVIAHNVITDDLNIKAKEINEKEMNEDQFAKKGQHRSAHKNGVKTVSERKRVMVTCDIVLKETTACPFRHHKSWFQCFFCPDDFMEINILRQHTLVQHSNIDEELKKIKRYPRSLQIEISNLECRECRLNLEDVNSMRSHLEVEHKKVIYTECIADYKVNASPYTCHICKLEFHVFRTLTTHLNEHYANCICDVCGKSFLNSKRLKVHKRTHENGQFPCSECGKILKTKTSRANHMESAHSKRVLKCQICYKPMKHYNDRIKHMSDAHNITHKFKCPICDREYNIKHYLATHIRQTHGHKNKKCLECGMAFVTNHGLKKHMLKHSGQKPYSCNMCCKSYARSYTLREHMRVHDSDRRFAGIE